MVPERRNEVTDKFRTLAHSRCGCCSAGVEETIRHALFECKAHEDIRKDCFGRMDDVCPDFKSMSTDAKLRLFMSEDTPKELDNFLYRYLIQIFVSRERRLESGLAGGRL